MKKKILYLMGIDWYWIKQRPQMIAIELDKEYSVTVVYLSEIFNKASLRQERDELKRCKSVPALPYRDKNRVVSYVEKLLMRWAIGNIRQYDIIWVGHPNLYKYISPKYDGKIVYDCMDDHAALCGDHKIRSEIEKNEKKLVRRSDIVFATSQVLKRKMEAAGGQEKTFLNRNGFHCDHIYPPQTAKKKDRYKIGYIGTIAEWMDFDLLQASLKANSQIEYHFMGPVSGFDIPEHPRIFYEGIVEHSQLYEKTKDYDCLIMPFIVNDIVLAVDPVKLYEYISMGKCVISVWYEEVDRFEPFVYFYKTKEELGELLKKLCEDGFWPKYTENQQQLFLKNNSWQARCKQIKDQMRKLLKTGEQNKRARKRKRRDWRRAL